MASVTHTEPYVPLQKTTKFDVSAKEDRPGGFGGQLISLPRLKLLRVDASTAARLLSARFSLVS